MNKEEVLAFLKSKKQEFHTEFHVSEMALFGSLARNEQHSKSDIDLIVEFDPDTKDIYAMKEGIKKIVSKQFHTSVDIGRKKNLKPYYKAQIMNDVIFI